jgi:peptidoglycan glycosyltransferase/penicillin-binding protein 2
MGRKKGNINHRRLIVFKYIGSLMFLALVGRLYFLQVYDNEDLRLASLKQRSTEISLNSSRGTIFDRNLIPLTNNEITRHIVVLRDLIINDNRLLEEIKSNSLLSYKEFDELLKTKDRLLKIPIVKEMNFKENNIFSANIIDRYSKANLLSHVIGYINKAENRGESGIEKVYDEFLNKSDKESLFVEYDKSRSLILGSSYYVDSSTSHLDPNGVQLTIDYQLQKVSEKILDENKTKGSVIVADVESGEILALTSRPNFNQNNMEEYLNGSDMNLYNKAIQVSYPPGSIFKIIVLLAALEKDESYINHNFYCKGYEEIGDLKVKCNNIYGHGKISLKDGFSKSCNSVFIQIGKDIGAEKIIEMATKLGLGEKVNIGLIEETSGNLPIGEDLLGPVIGNISIGQGKIETTPLQITNMLLTIANNGIEKDMTIVKGITSKDGNMIKPYNKEDDTRIISKEFSEITQEFLREVALTGTAKSLDLDHIGGAAGKTGSAEAFFKGKETVHGWFTGYYPADNPKYVITVLVEQSDSGSKSATPIFEKICKEIYELEN